ARERQEGPDDAGDPLDHVAEGVTETGDRLRRMRAEIIEETGPEPAAERRGGLRLQPDQSPRCALDERGERLEKRLNDLQAAGDDRQHRSTQVLLEVLVLLLELLDRLRCGLLRGRQVGHRLRGLRLRGRHGGSLLGLLLRLLGADLLLTLGDLLIAFDPLQPRLRIVNPLLGATDRLAGCRAALGRALARPAGLLVRPGQSLLSSDRPLGGRLALLLRRDTPVVALYTLGLLLVQTLLRGLQLLDGELGAL